MKLHSYVKTGFKTEIYSICIFYLSAFYNSSLNLHNRNLFSTKLNVVITFFKLKCQIIHKFLILFLYSIYLVYGTQYKDL